LFTELLDAFYVIGLVVAKMQRAYGRTSFSARGYLGTHKTSTMDMGKHVAIKKGMGATAPQPFDRPELNHSVSSYAKG